MLLTLRQTSFVVLSLACTVLPVTAKAGTGFFPDVPMGLPFRDAVVYVREKGIMNGYSDGVFRPDRTMTRAELLKVLVTAVPAEGDSASCSEESFSDVPARAWFAEIACKAKRRGIIRGFDDGTLRPGDSVTLADASMMFASVFGAEPRKSEPWFRTGVEFLASKGALPQSLGHGSQQVTRAEVAEILSKVLEGNGTPDTRELAGFFADECGSMERQQIAHIDMQEVRRVWLQWYNDARAAEGLPPYRQSRQLERTANLWSAQAASKGTITHQRVGQTAYYDYGRMTNWFADFGLEFQNDSGSTFTESIGWGYYDCDSADCTGNFLKGIRSTFDFFMNERGKAYRPHFNSIMNPHFEAIGIGIAVDSSSRKYYLTTHYGTVITSDPAPVCL